MNLTRFLMLCAAFCCINTAMNAGKPKWVNNTPKEQNDTYRFIVVESHGHSIAEARTEAKQRLAENEQLRRAVTVSSNFGNLQQVDQLIVNGKMTETINNSITIETKISGQDYGLQACPVDEYMEQTDGKVKLYTLYMVGVADHVRFDHVYKTTSYGVTPALMSIVPGLGQFYKGSTVKGVCMLGGVAAFGIGALFCENERADYKNKMKEQPRFAKDYNTKANNYETARNICLGTAAAVWVYNIIDAAAARGARRIIVKPATGSYLSVHPVATPTAVGFSLSYNFK